MIYCACERVVRIFAHMRIHSTRLCCFQTSMPLTALSLWWWYLYNKFHLPQREKPSRKQRLTNHLITSLLCLKQQTTNSWLLFNFGAIPLSEKPNESCNCCNVKQWSRGVVAKQQASLKPALGLPQWTYQAIQNGGAEVVQFEQCLHPSRDCGIHSDNRFDVQECESCQCSSQWPDKTVDFNSEPADLVKIKWLLAFARCLNGILLSVTIVRVPFIELGLPVTFDRLPGKIPVNVTAILILISLPNGNPTDCAPTCS